MPPILDYEGYHRYVDNHLPGESPVLYGLHSNAEVGCLTDASNNLLRALHLLEPSTATDHTQDIPLNNNPNECAVVAASNEEKVRYLISSLIRNRKNMQLILINFEVEILQNGMHY